MTILWDVDGTLLDFLASEREAIFACFRDFSLGECTDEMLKCYSAINVKWWQKMERGECSHADVKRERFVEFFSIYGLSTDIDALNRQFQIELGETVCFQPHALETLRALHGRARQYVVTNGTAAVQHIKLEKSGIINLIDGAFISEEIGAEKPQQAFFNTVLREIGNPPRETVWIVGDSLTSDMAGGAQAGIHCCFYNPNRISRPENLRIDKEITDLSQLLTILE